MIAGAQTLIRALDILDVVAQGPVTAAGLAAALDLQPSTARRLANALVQRGYLRFEPQDGYRLGASLVRLSAIANRTSILSEVALPRMKALAEQTMDAVNLGVREGASVLYIQQVAGQRRVTVRHRPGQANRLVETALGRALMLDEGPDAWLSVLGDDQRLPTWAAELSAGKARGYCEHAELDGDRIHCLAAPIRQSDGKIVAAISVSSVHQYMGGDRPAQLGRLVCEAAREISSALGWSAPEG